MNSFIQHVAGQFFWKDTQGRYLGCSPSLLENSLLNLTKESIIGKTDHEFLTLEVADRLYEHDQAVLTSGKTRFFLEQIVSSMETLYLTVVRMPIFDDHGQIIGIFGQILNLVTQHPGDLPQKISSKSGELTELNKNRQLLDQVLEITPGFIYWKDLNGVYLGSNENSCAFDKTLFNQAIVGKTDEQLWPTDAIEIKARDAQVLASGLPHTARETRKTYDGKEYLFNTITQPLWNEHQQTVGLVGSLTDITEIHQLKENLRQKSQFIAGLSHDIRSPLSGMIMTLDLLIKNLDGQYQKIATEISTSCQSLLNLLENYIEMSKVDLTGVTLTKRAFLLSHLLLQIQNLFLPTLNNKNVVLRIEQDSHIPKTIIADDVKISRVLINLISNAIKFTTVGSITVRAQLGKQLADEQFVLKISVEDTGQGIPESFQEKIFKEFQKLAESNQAGHGLGLYMVKRFVEAMGGEIYFKSQEGVGTRFVLAIPVKRPLLDKDLNIDDNNDSDNNHETVILDTQNNIQPPSLALNCCANPNINNKKILILEDDFLTQIGLHHLLQAYSTELFDQVAPALAAFRANDYDLIITDLHINVNSYEESQIIHLFQNIKIEKNKTTPIIAMSAEVTNEMKEHFQSHHQIEIYHKPISQITIDKIIKKYL